MAVRKSSKNSKSGNGANIGYEAQLWHALPGQAAKLDKAIAHNLKELGYGG